MTEGPAVEVKIGAAGRNWERPPPPPLNPRTEALGAKTMPSQLLLPWDDDAAYAGVYHCGALALIS